MTQGVEPFSTPENVESVVQAMKSAYCFFRQKYVVLAPGYTKTTMHYFTDRVLESHIAGQYAVGVFAGEKATSFITFDIDAGGKAAVRKVMGALTTMGFPKDRIYVSTSGKKGYHVDMFFEPYIYNERARNIYDLVIWMTGASTSSIEFRPTHTQAIKLPLGIHATTRKRCWFLDPQTLDPIEDLTYVTTVERIPSHLCGEILKKWNKKHWNELYADMICGDRTDMANSQSNYDFSRKNEYYAAHRLTESHTRHGMMVEMARDIRYNGATANQITKFLMGWYYHQDPVLIGSSEDEVRADAEAIAEWAEESVPVLRVRQMPAECKPIIFTKRDIGAILRAPTSAARRVALLLYTYCKMFGATKISYAKIAETTNCVEATAKSAVAFLVKLRIVNKQSGGLHVSFGKMVKRSNTYFIPKGVRTVAFADGDLIADEYVFTEPYDKTNFDKFYCKVLGAICTDKCLERYLTKPELADVQKARQGE